MAEITTDGTTLTIEMTGMHKLYALRSRIEIPLANVRGATADPDAVTEPKGIRAPGTHVPGLIVAGTYYSQGERTFWDVTDPSKTVVIELDDEKYDRLIVGVDDPQATVAAVNAALSSH